MFTRLLPRFSYYKTLSEGMQVRKEIVKDNRKIKRKLERINLPRVIRTQEFVQNNPKKLLFLLAMMGVFQYYGWFYGMYKYFRSMERIDYKFRRWFLGEKNQVPPTVTEQFYNGDLKKDTVNELESLYFRLEQQLKYGVNRKLLFETYDEMNLFDKDEERQGFYKQSGYYKKRNQKLCGVHCISFVNLFEEAMTKMRKKNRAINEDEFLSEFKTTIMKKVDKIREWESRLDEKRKEHQRLTPHLIEQKQTEIKRLLSENPYISLAEMDQKIADIGMIGLSLKDKLQINFQQLCLHEVLLDSYKERLDKNLGSIKEPQLRQKVKLYEQKVEEYKNRQNELKTQFVKYFKKSDLFS